MNYSARKRILIAALFVVCLLLLCGATRSSFVTFGQNQVVRRWQPKVVPASAIFVGDQACVDCHKDEVTSQRLTSMGMAMEPVASAGVLSSHKTMKHSIGGFSYEITRKGEQSFYSVTDGTDSVTIPIKYAFGQGKAGQTYVLEYDGGFYESLLSYYNEIDGLDFTIGAQRGIPKSLRAAVGRRLSDGEVVNCFACHSTGAVTGGKLHLEKLTPGIRCESCHGPGGEHINAIKNGGSAIASIFNPAKLSGDEITEEFCASCHRGNDEYSVLQRMEINNVRFQPYRVFKSSCYSDDHRISCEACHNPHEPLKVGANIYDAKCLACHLAGGKPAKGTTTPSKSSGGPFAPACKVATKDCVTCHMLKVELPGSHFKFTDHYIRINKPGSAFPN